MKLFPIWDVFYCAKTKSRVKVTFKIGIKFVTAANTRNVSMDKEQETGYITYCRMVTLYSIYIVPQATIEVWRVDIQFYKTLKTS